MTNIKISGRRYDYSMILASLNYYPEPTGIAPYSTSLAESLAAIGVQVEVVTGYPHYPQWQVHADFTGMSMKQNLNGVRVRRLRHHIPAVPKFLSRIHMELSFGLRTVIAKWRKPAIILTVSPALFSSAMTIMKARATGTPVAVWVQDLYSRGFEETSGGKSLVSRMIKAVEGRILRSANGVAVIHERFGEYLIHELDVPHDKIRVIRNWSHIELPQQIDRESVRARLGWRPDEVIALHAGNMGVKQDLGNVIEAADLASSAGSAVRFILLGDGNQRPALEKQADGVGNLTFMNPLPGSDFVAALQAADVLLVNELPGVKEMSVPSKLTSYFATGQPIVAATEPDSATADEIRASGSGMHVRSGNPSALLAAVEDLADDHARAATYSASGIPYAKSILSEERAIADFSAWLYSIANARK